MLTSSRIIEYLADLESEKVERTVSVSNTDKFCEAICAFSNDIGNSKSNGYLFVGATDNGTIAGLKGTDQIMLKLAALRTDGNILPQPALTVYKVPFPEGDIIVLEVTPSNFPPVRYKGKVWIRVGLRKAIANETEELILIEKRTTNATTFDARPNYNSSIDNFDKAVEKYKYTDIRQHERIVERFGNEKIYSYIQSKKHESLKTMGVLMGSGHLTRLL